MGILQRIANYFRGKSVEPLWQQLSRGYSIGYYDAFNNQKEPSRIELVRAFEDTAYACANLIASTVASVPLRLYVQTNPGDARPKCKTRPIGQKTWDRLNREPGLSKRLGKALELQEVTEHPLLDLLHKVNDQHNFYDLLELTDLYQEVTGSSYWYLSRDAFGLPSEIFILPSQYITPQRDQNGNVTGYAFGYGMTTQNYSPEDIVHFRFLSLQDPYCDGYSPLRAAWERVRLGKLELAFNANSLANQARPDAVLTPQEPIGPAEAERLAREFSQRFRQGGSGGILVMPEPMNLQPLSFSPKDVGQVDLFKFTKLQIANAFGVPISLLDTETSNRSVAEAGLYQLAVFAIKPRVRRRDEKMNERICPMFDERLFVASDDPVPENREFELQKRTAYLAAGVITRDEVRQAEGYDSQEWAREPLLPAGMFPADSEPITGLPSDVDVPEPGAVDVKPEDERPDPATPEQAPAAASNDLRATVGGSVAVADLQRSYYRHELPRDAAIANAVLIFGFSEEEAANLFPELAPDAPAVQSSPEAAPTAEAAPDANVTPAKGIRKAFSRAKAQAKFVKTLQRFFRYQRAQVLKHLKAIDLDAVATKADPFRIVDLSGWSAQMAEELLPIVSLFADHASYATAKRIGADNGLVPVVQPKLAEALQKATLAFCEETNQTTSLALQDALEKLRGELAEGISAGERQNELTKRVQAVFDHAERDRAFRIAVTETSRAQHEAQLVVSQESGLVKGFKWVLSSMPCEVCKRIAHETPFVKLGDNFMTKGEGPYGEVKYPPAHPHCQCTIVEVLNDG